MDVFTLVEGYMNKMFSGVEGMKILLVDRETVKNNNRVTCNIYFSKVRYYKSGHVSIEAI